MNTPSAEKTSLLRKDGDDVASSSEAQKQLSERAFPPDPPVFSITRGAAYNFTPEEREKVPSWSDHELLQDIIAVLAPKECAETSFGELVSLSAALLKKRARSLKYISRRTHRSRSLSTSGNKPKLLARILTWYHVHKCGCYLFISSD